ncbi:SH3 domain-containing protein [Gymnodinialimonas sp. 57CJ19]|uniref:SH3 domain-containing protein n=1 Tax=Gymnodinialimonas sp. 57CJ19 TaxID=3138498 RepID=UPI0031342BCF
MSATLAAALYVAMIVIPGEDHGAQVEVTSSTSRASDPITPLSPRNEGASGWIQSFIASAQAGTVSAPNVPISRRQYVTSGNALIADEAGSLMLATNDGEYYMIDAVINPADLIGDENEIASVAVAALAQPEEITATGTEQPTAAETSPEVWRVAASAVNFREGPSTNTAVLTSLRRGAEVEFLAEAPDNWARLRIVGSDLEGYMAAEFLEPVVN